MFIGSSSEALKIARAARDQLRRFAEVKLWTDGVFSLSRGTLESLIHASGAFDYGLFVFAHDDKLLIRKSKQTTPRDNVLFELGMFLGALGRERCFFMLPSDSSNLRVATDLAGITAATYGRLNAVSYRDAVRPACEQVLSTMRVHQSTGLSGDWAQSWGLQKGRRKRRHASLATLRQMGAFVKGRWTAFKRTYELNGQLEGSLLTGTWRDSAPGHAYFGAFQLVVSPLQDKMTGKWSGWSRKGTVRAGEWVWTRPDGSEGWLTLR
jgi:hypothetical protein